MMKSKKIAKFAQKLFITMAIVGVVCGSSMTANATELSEDAVPESEIVEEVAVEAVSELEEEVVEETLEATEAASGTWTGLDWYYSDGTLTIEYIGNPILGGGMGTPSYSYLELENCDEVASGYPWYPYKDSITKIVIGEDVENIGAAAFCNMTKLEEVSVINTETRYQDGLSSIDSYAFANCTSLKQMRFTESGCSIKEGAFYNCTSLEKIYGNIRVEEKYAFNGCTKLSEIEMVDYAGDYAFENCKSIATVNFRDDASIGSHAFAGCTGLKEVTVNSSEIGKYAFKDCTGLAKINLPKDGCSIGEGGFYNCINLAEIKGYISYPDEYSFYNCKKLTNPSWTSEIGYIGNYAYYGCSSLKELNFTTYISIDEYAFAKCTGVNKVVFKEEIYGLAAHAFSQCNLKEMWFEKEQHTLWSSVYDNVLEGNASCKVYGVYDSIPERIAEENNCTFVPTDKLPQPEMGTLSSAVNGLRVKWDKTDYALTYDVYRSTLVGGNYTLLKKGVSGTEYIDTTATPGVKYYYKVIAVGELAKSELSEASVAGMYLKAPTFKKMVNVVSGVHVYWNAAQGAKTYSVYRSTSKTGDFTLVKSGLTATHYIDTTVASGKTYYYKVLAVNGSYSTSSYVEPFKPYTYVGTPDITSRINKGAGIQLGWNKIAGATGYAIYRKPYEGGAWARVATISGNSTFTWTDTTVKGNNGTIYRYTVRALAGSDMKTLSGCRNTGRTMVRLSSRTLNSAVKASATSIKCNWTTSSAVTGYEVRFMIGSTVYRTFTVGNYKTGVKTFTGLPSGNTYKIQVRAYKKVDGVGSFYSAWSTAKTVSL